MRGRAFGLFSAIVGFAPIVGGFLLAHLSWSWIFFINLPVGIITAGLALRFTPSMRSRRRHRLDQVGVALDHRRAFPQQSGVIRHERTAMTADQTNTPNPRRIVRRPRCRRLRALPLGRGPHPRRDELPHVAELPGTPWAVLGRAG
ncbi:MFS transporter [Actinomadura sp. 6N118]|uniref:MFS transporter n=1 Tax=Actinomadura sp. 6N118 TaxID=3375151 RepID=UPI0037B37987